MKIQFIKSFSDIPYDDWQPVAKPEHFGKVARIMSDGKRTLMICLPCGHVSSIAGWDITDIDTDTPSATPSIFCQGKGVEKGESGACWHGYLTKGELIQ